MDKNAAIDFVNKYRKEFVAAMVGLGIGLFNGFELYLVILLAIVIGVAWIYEKKV